MRRRTLWLTDNPKLLGVIPVIHGSGKFNLVVVFDVCISGKDQSAIENWNLYALFKQCLSRVFRLDPDLNILANKSSTRYCAAYRIVSWVAEPYNATNPINSGWHLTSSK